MAKAPEPSLRARIGIAEGYPFKRPPGSYLFADGAMRRLDAVAPGERTPVIAGGSTAAPKRLAAKFAGMAATIPVTRARLRGFVVVYAAHLTSYGSLPATLHPHPNAETEVFVTWLTAVQLEQMHASEGVGQRYDYVELAGLDLRDDYVRDLGGAGTYVARNGALSVDGRPVRLAQIPTSGCVWEVRSQAVMLRWVHAKLAPEVDFHAFMHSVLESEPYRRGISMRLRSTALRWSER